MKNIYFLSDAHLGSWALDHRRMQERRLVRFLDSIKDKAAAIYLLGDMFDFWYEYKFVVPRGYTRFLGKLSELTDMGVEVHFFTGNHDIWAFDYLERECGVILHKQPLTVELYGKIFYLAHGDGLGDPDKKFKFIRAVFHNPVCQHLFSAIHPRWGMWFGQTWAKHSRMKRPNGEEPPYMGEDREHLILYTKEYMKAHPDVDVFIYGHRHIEIDLQVSKKARAIILGDWISQFSYVVYDGDHLFMQQYIEGESVV
ncbi:UDP-2,3-diacylglucosamine diphosphatase [Xylanibacter brevis]|uniref:UDP-2,3-diacylglucosamine diphosphatase n=1 Tax=Xylanibacter brevis TaxID=83231 RepID=UPI00047F5A2A|nr:UDP-2,3-diacylglucosamine diphosphatase [Xylanibacter brevis]